VKGVIQRFQGNYAPPSISLMARILDALLNTEFWPFRGFFFQEE
jgi:hypothetical protein